jgi:cellulose synthase/poly-beta-1,6-N-acetylglucosamine synthase-like glycosyltransferase
MWKYFKIYFCIFALGLSFGIWQHQNIAPFFELNRSIILGGLLTSLFVVFNIIDFYFIFHAIYTFLIGLAGLKAPNDKVLKDKNEKLHSFVLIVCAHNERAVIGNSLQEMLKLNYPKELIRILVICDNCSDDTADLAREIGKQEPGFITVLERFNNEKKGKPHAVKYALDYVDEHFNGFEAISIADADNIYDVEYFQVMNQHLNRGAEIIQGYLGVKNPDDSMTSRCGMYSYSATARVYFGARQNLGMSSTLGGTGFVVTRKALSEVGWDMFSLVEDFEFSTKAIIMGKKIDFAYGAITYDEKPTTMKVSLKQRTRWMQGHWDVAIRQWKSVIQAFFKKGSNKADLFDYFLYLWSPLRMALYCYLFISIAITWYCTQINFNYLDLILIPWWFKLGVSVANLLQDYIYATLEGVKWYKIWVYPYYYLIFGMAWIPASINGFIKRNSRVWVKTEHKIVAKVEKLGKVA